MTGTPATRLFFALWPEPEVRARLDHLGGMLHRLHGGRCMTADSLHLTLVFIGALAPERVAALLPMAGAVSARACRVELELERAACWPHNRIVCLEPGRPPAALAELVAGLEQGLGRLRIGHDRRPHRPHVTLLRHADCRRGPGSDADVAPLPGLPLSWSANEFVLLASSSQPDGARYRLLGRWPLTRCANSRQASALASGRLMQEADPACG